MFVKTILGYPFLLMRYLVMYRILQFSSAHPRTTIRPGSGQDPHDEEYMDARPDKEEMEEAIENFLSRLEKQEQRA